MGPLAPYKDLVVVAGIILLVGGVYFKGWYDRGNADAVTSARTAIDIREKENEARDNRPSTAGLLDLMRRGRL